MPYINVDEAYILDNTGLQVDNSVDYANANGNRNLLDNPFFTVNQRDFTTGTGSASGLALVDRWKAIRATVTQNADNSLTVTPTQAQYGICQFFEQNRLKVGQTYTMSALIDNEYYSGSFVFSTSPASEYFATFSNGIRFYRHVANDKVDVWVIRSSTTAFTVQAVKLELGSYSTLINDVPPDYGEELRKCQRYFQRVTATNYYAVFGTGYGWSATEAYIFVPTPVSLRDGGTITAVGSNIANFRTLGTGTNSYTISELSYQSKTQSGVTLHITGTFTAYGAAILFANNSALYIDLSADL